MRLNRDYAFQDYIVGDNNKGVVEAISSAMTIPGQIHNPLFIYGSVGVGKTHLLQALAHEYASGLKVYYATIEKFINNITQAIQNHRYINFIEHYLDFDVLLIDDIHLIKDRKSTLEEMLHIFERLYKARKQIVLSADRPPQEIFNTKDKAYRIFQKGLILKIHPPGYRDRLKFLQAKAENAGLSLTSSSLKSMAQRTNPDVRELEGILTKTKLRYELTQG